MNKFVSVTLALLIAVSCVSATFEEDVADQIKAILESPTQFNLFESMFLDAKAFNSTGWAFTEGLFFGLQANQAKQSQCVLQVPITQASALAWKKEMMEIRNISTMFGFLDTQVTYINNLAELSIFCDFKDLIVDSSRFFTLNGFSTAMSRLLTTMNKVPAWIAGMQAAMKQKNLYLLGFWAAKFVYVMTGFTLA